MLRLQHLLEPPNVRRDDRPGRDWPDASSNSAPFRYASPWHYQNVHICRPFDLAAACPDGACLTAQIARHRATLADRSAPARERLLALAFLTHLIGDLHQPLQIGDRGDRGGNDLHIAYGLIGGRTNLDQILDGYVAERAISTSPAGARGLLSELDREARRAERAAASPLGAPSWSSAESTLMASRSPSLRRASAPRPP